MEKQRNSIKRKSGRRLLVFLLVLFSTVPFFSQTLTLEQVRKLRITPEENQNLYTKTDLKFSVIIPKVRPAQVQVVSAEQGRDISFRSMRKIEDYDENGTILEIWYTFDKKGTYNLTPLTVMLQDRRRTIAFESVTITDDPAKMLPRIVIVFEDGTIIYSDDESIPLPLKTVPVGKKLKFTVNLQYATQIFKFNWDIPKNSIFTQTKEYEITEVKYRERIYSHNLIPVADFEWTGLIEEDEPFPRFRINASDYNGYRTELFLPDMRIHFTTDNSYNSSVTKNDIFEDAFYSDDSDETFSTDIEVTAQDCKKLAELYTKEHYAFFTYFSAKKARTTFEKELGLPATSSEIFSSAMLYISVFALIILFVFLIYSAKHHYKIRILIFTTFTICAAAFLFFSLVKRTEHYGISCSCKIYSIPKTTADAVSDIGAGSRVRILENTDKWVYVEVGETGGWCSKDNIYIIK